MRLEQLPAYANTPRFQSAFHFIFVEFIDDAALLIVKVKRQFLDLFERTMKLSKSNVVCFATLLKNLNDLHHLHSADARHHRRY